ncbi:MAG: rod shape-determining protein RodA [Verrucomicrobia bacterium]|nr:MAG: rod shape-determining protein RodA [Verrucomicrobiota bacterium]HTD84945.1 rod shape-determining protein RodA [Candidatus Binatia bacterium]
MIALGKDHQSRFDWLQLTAISLLMVIGIAFVFSATSTDTSVSPKWYNQLFVRQIIWCVAGMGAAGVVCFVDYHVLARWSFVAYWAAIVLLVLVFIIGPVRWGAQRWIDLGPFQLQPSEFAKLAFILALANFLSRPTDELRQPGIFWKAVGLMVLPFLLILKEPDLGSALIFLPMGLAMMFVAGVPVRFLARLVGGGALMILLIMVDVLFAPPQWQIKLEDYQKRRLLVYFGLDGVSPDASPGQRADARRAMRNYSYNVDQALISVGSGGMFGKGFRQGTQNALGYLPKAVAHNDFIFSVIAEEKGFMGSVTVIALYSVVLFTGIRIAGQARDRLGKLLATGIVAMWFSHIFINIGMNIRLMPVTGVPLPLLSYGGSSVICSLIAAGILQNVYIYRRSY